MLHHVTNINKSLCVHKHIHTNKYIEQLNNNNTCIYKRNAKDFSRSRECEFSISGTFVRLNVLNYKRAEQSVQEGEK